MNRQRLYLGLALVISALFGIVLPLVFGIGNLQSIAIIFSSIWFIFAVGYLVVTFLIRGRRNLKKRLEEGINDKWGYS